MNQPPRAGGRPQTPSVPAIDPDHALLTGASGTITGFLYGDVDSRNLANGTLVSNMTLVCAGREGYTFWRVSAFGEFANKYLDCPWLGPGSIVVATGTIELRWYEQDGKRKSSLSLTATEVRPVAGPQSAVIDAIKALTGAGRS